MDSRYASSGTERPAKWIAAVGGQTAIGRGIFSANGPITIDGECSVENSLIGNLLKNMSENGGGEA